MKKCKINQCWICKKAGTSVSGELHDFIVADATLKSRYYLTVNYLCEFLIGEEEFSKIVNGMGDRANFNWNPLLTACQVLAKVGLKNRD